MAERRKYHIEFTLTFRAGADRYGLSFADACKNLQADIERLGAEGILQRGYLSQLDGTGFDMENSTVTIPEHDVPVSQEDEALRMLSQVREV